jgi:hypothetical protein
MYSATELRNLLADAGQQITAHAENDEHDLRTAITQGIQTLQLLLSEMPETPRKELSHVSLIQTAR